MINICWQKEGVGLEKVFPGKSLSQKGEDLCRSMHQSFLENIDRRGCNDGNRKLWGTLKKCRSSPSATVDYINLS